MIKNVGPIRFDSNGTADLGPTICTQKADRFKSAPHLPKTYLSGGFLESMSGVLKLLDCLILFNLLRVALRFPLRPALLRL